MQNQGKNQEKNQENVAHLLISPIPREIVVQIEKYLRKLLPRANFIVAGSFRRQMPQSRDIDIIVPGTQNLTKIWEILSQQKCIKQTAGEAKMSVLIYFRGKYHKADFFYCTAAEKWPMLLYATGSKEFNIRMRARAKSMGYLLNQRGLFRAGKKISGLRSERAYFDILGMKYLPPEMR